MPLYELFCLARPALPRAALAEVIEAAGRAVFAKGGVVTDIKSYGDRKLAYEIRKPGAKYEQAAMWQLSFMAHPGTLSDVEHNLKVDERVLRYMLLKKRHLQPNPNTHKVAQKAGQLLAKSEGVPQQHDPIVSTGAYVVRSG